MQVLRVIVLAVMVASISGSALAAVDADEHTLAVSRRLMSPFCPGKTLASCTSRSAAEWVEEIRQWVRDGVSDEEILARLQARVPEFDLDGDPGGAWNWLLGLLAATLVTGVLVVASRRLIGRRRPAPAAGAESDAEANADWDDRLDDELRDFDD